MSDHTIDSFLPLLSFALRPCLQKECELLATDTQVKSVLTSATITVVYAEEYEAGPGVDSKAICSLLGIDSDDPSDRPTVESGQIVYRGIFSGVDVALSIPFTE